MPLTIHHAFICPPPPHTTIQPGTNAYALALLRALLPSLRHPLARVRAAALGAVGAIVAVPDRARCKGAGSAAIEELVGFRRDNVLSVAAFYRREVDVNYLAEARVQGVLFIAGWRARRVLVVPQHDHRRHSSCATRRRRCAPACWRCCAGGCSACPTAAPTTRAWCPTS